MLKTLMFAVVPVVMLAGTTFAGEKAGDIEEALTIDASTIQTADSNIIEDELNIDVDQMTSEAGTAGTSDAIEASFRRFGYHRGGWGGWGGGYRRHYSPHYRPFYSAGYHNYYGCATPVYHSPCVYHSVCQPSWSSYWGCN